MYYIISESQAGLFVESSNRCLPSLMILMKRSRWQGFSGKLMEPMTRALPQSSGMPLFNNPLILRLFRELVLPSRAR